MYVSPTPNSSQGTGARNLTAALEKLEQWRTVVGQHDPGQYDEAARTIAG
jgi:hypothetical protein